MGIKVLPSIQNDTDLSQARRTAIVIAGSKYRHDAILAVANICNCTILNEILAPDDYWPMPGADMILVDLPSITERYEQTLSEIARYLNQHRNFALIWTNMELLEEAYAILPSAQCQFLVDGSDFDAVPYLTGAITRGAMDQLHDNSRESEFGALHRISDELAAFAQTLARIADQDDSDKGNMVSDKPVTFRPAPSAIFHPFVAPDPVAKVDDDLNAKAIRDIIKLRRMRDDHFKSELFADPAWDILLDLMAARLEGKSVSVSSLCIAAAVPPTTALRWVTGMTESGMLVRRMDPNDARRVFIELSEETADRLGTFFKAAKSKPGFLI
jgi:DNA-binding MarR family transcriptional regulator